MAKLQYRSISRRTVDALSVEKDTVFWDRELAGFGVRVYPSGSQSSVPDFRDNRHSRVYSTHRWIAPTSSGG